MRAFDSGQTPAGDVNSGEVAEWSNAPDSKSGVLVSSTEGSNPSFSAS